jgi:prepilin peptidase CpaA
VASLVTSVFFVAMLVLAAALDLATRRIPNWLVFGGGACALALRAGAGVGSVWEGLLGVSLAFGLTLPLFAVGALGGGDAKLLMAVGAFMGPGRLVGALLVIAIVGGIIALLFSAGRGVLLPALLNARAMLGSWLRLGRRGADASTPAPSAATIPYGLAIAIGAVVWWFWGGPLL